jgi:hypothetical protein
LGQECWQPKKALATGGHADPTNGYRKDLMGIRTKKRGVVNSIDDAEAGGWDNGIKMVQIGLKLQLLEVFCL